MGALVVGNGGEAACPSLVVAGLQPIIPPEESKATW